MGESAGRLTHLDEHGNARMVDVTAKAVTWRSAEARCTVRATPAALAALADADADAGAGAMEMVRGDARAAGVLAAKLTSQLIPLCHPLPLDSVTVQIQPGLDGIQIVAVTAVEQRTGVEMEALSACALAGLSVVAALLPHDPLAHLDDLTLWHKSGGRSGTWHRDAGTGAMEHAE